MSLDPVQLDLSKSADSQEKFRTKRLVAWETAPFIFYVAALIGGFIALRGTKMIDAPARVEVMSALGLILLLGAVILLAGWKIRKLKQDNDYRRAILVSVLEGQPGGHLITDAKARTIYANTKFQKALNNSTSMSVSELPLYTTSGNDEASDNLQEFIEQAKSGLGGEMVFPFSRAGFFGWYRLAVRPIESWRGYTHWQLEDISGSYEDSQRLGRERVRLIEFLDHAPVGFFSVDEQGTFIFTNDTFVSWLGAEDKDLGNGSFHLHDVLIDVPANIEPYDILPTPQDAPVQRGEIKMRAFDGREFQAAVSHTILRGTDGTVRTRSIIRDLTPERAWKTALKQSEDRFQRFFEEAPLGIALVDSRGKITECNDAFAAMLNKPLHELLGAELLSLVKETSRAKAENVFGRIRGGLKPESAIEIELNTGPDKSVITQMFASPFMGENGVVLHFINVTERKNLEAQFTQSQKMQAVGQLAGGIAHDFNNLLTAMIGFCDLLLMRHRPGDSSFADIMQIKQNANRAANLVRQLLAFSRQQTLQPKVMDVTDVITDVSHLLRRLIGAGIDLKINHERDLGLVKVDQGQMEQVLVNLAVNARDAMGHGGVLTIKTRNFINKKTIAMVGTDEMPPGEWVAIDVGDTGTGIPPEVVARIFDPFFSTKPLGAGTGLGLSTVYGIIRQSNGYVGVETTVGRGTTFSIYMPRAEEVAAVKIVAPTIEKVEDLTGSSRILLVEDEDAVRAFSVRALQNKGYEVFEASSGDNALELVAEKKPKIDLMVSDVMMPGMDGIELGKRIRETYPDLSIIFMSGYTEDKFKDDMGPGIHFLAKPFTLKQLAEKVKEVLDGEK
ncbi:MAG: hybrid sensor histidine kinase/response regulator [Alphaproteobacteria bacterium]|nr:hybrid sensor histidine kinase/response regulator [Alphaproteobacteria bacterium]